MLSAKPWRIETVCLLIAAQIFFFILGGLAIVLLQKTGLPGFKNLDDFGNTLIATLSLQGATWVLMIIFLRFHGIGLAEGLGFKKGNLLFSLALALGVIIVILPVVLWLQGVSLTLMEKIHWKPHNEEAVSLLTNSASVGEQIYLGFFAVVLAPVAEEFIFRGVLFPFIKQLGFPKTAWIVVSLLFALIHADAAVFIPLFVLALAFTWLYQTTDNLLAPICAHASFNGINLVLLVLQTSFPQYLPPWLNSSN
ncbi:MAG TPA: type II CAAX endopeptidase family protein [Pseudomonadales bacterium]|nr:type II CAAX endopeptidase family protein [Pseudomonadales bacterium]